MNIDTNLWLTAGLGVAVLGAAVCLAPVARRRITIRHLLVALATALISGVLITTGTTAGIATAATTPGKASRTTGGTTTSSPATGTGTTHSSTTKPSTGPAAAKAKTTTTPATSTDNNFQGIYAFSGDNSPALASDPDVAGRSLVYYWGQLEPQPGIYRWDLIDADMAPWVAAGKKVILRVATAGWTAWDKTADSQHGTPAWVYTHGVKSVTEKDGAVLPQYWNPTFLTDLGQFLRAFATRYDTNPHVAAVDLAVGIGGETKPDSENNPNLLKLWQSIGYTDPLWWTTVQQIITLYTSAFHHTPLALMPDKTFLGTTPGYTEATTLTYAVSKGIWLQDNGLLPGRTLPAPWGQTPLISEQRNPTTTDGNSLTAELQAALNNKARLILVFTTDLTNPADQATIHHYAGLATGSDSTTTGTPCQPGPVRASTGAAASAAVMCPLTGSTTTTTPTHPGHPTTHSHTAPGQTKTTGTGHAHHHRSRNTHTRAGHSTSASSPTRTSSTAQTASVGGLS